MIRGFEKLALLSSPPEIIPRIIKLPEARLKFNRIYGFVGKDIKRGRTPFIARQRYQKLAEHRGEFL